MPLLPHDVQSKRALAREIDWLEIKAAMQQFVKSIIPISVHEAARWEIVDLRNTKARVDIFSLHRYSGTTLA